MSCCGHAKLSVLVQSWCSHGVVPGASVVAAVTGRNRSVT